MSFKIHTTSHGWIKSPSYRPRRFHSIQSSNAPSQTTQPLSLIQWLVTTQGASPSDLKVERTFRGEELGYGLIATSNISADETIISVPLSSAITSEGASEAQWSIHMAEKILHAIKFGENTPWLDSLPKNINLPWLYWNPEEVAELGDIDTINEAYNLRTIFDTAVQKLCSGNDAKYRPAEVAYALSLVHSRSFLSNGIHVWVPGVDMCNHNNNDPDDGRGPNATVRCIHNPDVCQGAAATEEIAPPQVNSTPRPSTFELIAGEQGIVKGEEVTISYGKWPNDVFLLFFGFIPKDNSNDNVVLFQNLDDVVQFISEVVAEGTGINFELLNQLNDTEKRTQWYNELSKELKIEVESDFDRMVLTPAGIDYRLIDAVTASLQVFLATTLTSGVIHESGDDEYKIEENEEFLQALSVPVLIAARCHQILSSYPTSVEEDEKAVKDARGNYKTALEYRIGKKKILQSALAYFELQSE